MVALGDPPPAQAWEARTAHGATGPASYIPVDAATFSSTAAAKLKTRRAGRRAEEMRPCQMRVGAVPNAAGSAFVEIGGTKVMAAVYGPRQIERAGVSVAEGVLNVDVQFTAFSCRYIRKQENDKRAELYSSILSRALDSVVLLERYAKTMFDINLMILEDDGATLTSALTAASLALADATVEMRDIVAGASVCLTAAGGEQKGSLLLDCDGDEERLLPEASAILHLGLCPARDAVCMMHSAGPLPPQQFEQMVLLAKDTAAAVGAEMRKCLEHRVEKRAAKRQRLIAAVEDAAAEANAEEAYMDFE
eukprot:TRINITY_DN13896_c0_g1_i1.p1 TRINITY_DN13896_c0_g1~~TRINITY_DN13896_c0_g1_i1.p1  ORF type:complete len:307 (-),score=90.68 TRINITY_DN13896_c0_g1_i1:106-1026(-)